MYYFLHNVFKKALLRRFASIMILPKRQRPSTPGPPTHTVEEQDEDTTDTISQLQESMELCSSSKREESHSAGVLQLLNTGNTLQSIVTN